MLRVGPFCDPQVIALANRRFVPFAFDLNPRGGIGDAAARKVVVAANSSMAGRSGGAVSTPDVMFLTAEGKLLGKISNYSSEAEMLKAMQKVLSENPDYNKAGDDESKADSILEKGRIAFELTDYARATKELSASKYDEAKIMLAQIARYEADWEAAKSALSTITSEKWKDDVRMELVRIHVAKSEYEKALELAQGFPSGSNRYTEAAYFTGASQFHLGKPEVATATWKKLILGQETHDNWVYRADWAYCQLKQGQSMVMSTRGKRVSLLGRIGYLGRQNPDLAKRGGE